MTDDQILTGIKNGEYSLHDSYMEELRIDYLAQKMIFHVKLFREKGRRVKVQLIDVSELSGKMAFDPKNKEIILTFDIDQEHFLDLYTSHQTSLQCAFRTIEVSWRSD